MPSSGRTGARPRCATSSRRKACEALFQGRTGLVLDAYFSGTKLRWILDHVPDARKRAEAGKLCFGTVDSWLIWKLTGGTKHVTDATNASRTLLFNMHNSGVGRQAARPAGRAAQRSAQGRELLGGLRTHRAELARRRHPDRRHRRRSAGGLVRSALHCAGHGEEHLRHRLLHAHEHGRAAGRFDTEACSPRSHGG